MRWERRKRYMKYNLPKSSQGSLRGGFKERFGFTFRGSGFLSERLPAGWSPWTPHSWCINHSHFRSTSVEHTHVSQGDTGLKMWYNSDLPSSSLPQSRNFQPKCFSGMTSNTVSRTSLCNFFFFLKTGSDDRLAIVFILFACCQCEGIAALRPNKTGTQSL